MAVAFAATASGSRWRGHAVPLPAAVALHRCRNGNAQPPGPWCCLAAGLALALSGCSGMQSALDPAAEQSGHVFSLLQTMVWVCGAVYVLVLAFLGWALWRARPALRASASTSASTSIATSPAAQD